MVEERDTSKKQDCKHILDEIFEDSPQRMDEVLISLNQVEIGLNAIKSSTLSKDIRKARAIIIKVRDDIELVRQATFWEMNGWA